MANQNDGSKHAANRPIPVPPGGDCPLSSAGVFPTSCSEEDGRLPHLSLSKAGDGLGMSDRHGVVVFVNPRLCEMLDCEPDDVVGRPMVDFLSMADEGASAEPCPHCGQLHHHAQLTRPDRSSMAVAVDRQRLVDSQGQFIGTLDVIMDVTEKTRLERTLLDNAEWHRLIVSSLNDVFWVAQVDQIERRQADEGQMPRAIDVEDLLKRWRFTYVSPSFEHLFGYPPTSATSLNPYEAVPKTFHALIAEQLSHFIAEAMSSPGGASFPDTLVVPITTASGTQRWCETTARVLYDEMTKVLRFVGITRDVTETHQAEEAVRTSEEKLRAICAAAQDAVVMMDADGKATFWNPAAERMFGYRTDEVLGRDIHMLLAPRRLHEQVRRGVEEFRRSGKGAVIDNVVQTVATRKNGTEFPIEIAVSPLLLGGRWAAVGLVRDITDRTQAEEAVRKEQRRLAQLLDVYEGHRKMATYEIHDGVTQPLVSVLMTLDAFSRIRPTCPDAPWSDYDNAVTILREALAETRRFMSGMRPPVLDELGVVTALDHLICEHRVSGSAELEYETNVQFERLSPPLETTIFRVVQEGLANAERHSQSDRVRVEFTEHGDQLRILVEDWGVGFDPAKVPHDHFGLEGIRERTAAMGGTADIDSAPGKGTRVRVELPLFKRQPDQQE